MDEIILRQLPISNLLIQRIIAQIRIGIDAPRHQPIQNFLRPERPFPAEVLDKDGHHALDGAEDGAVDDDGTGVGRVGVRHVVGTVLELEPLGELEVQLDRRALVLAFQRIADRNVNLRAVEGAVAGVQLPTAAKGVQGVGEFLVVQT
ncbi:hypothetical protein BC936DRAFT_145001 [Jimgerdemannia flammicorona]|uniref:Uncharacterized protein n=1 Tax=Jimgerdemannia flammicorona TaxID=994334 RepID=A0A433DB52_9FUNG|nr:hypothetical protein BC936DRAFT_145001 [Jimgerdemannia flammicorona]